MFWIFLLILCVLVYIACALTDLVKMVREMHSMASVTEVRVSAKDLARARELTVASLQKRRTDHPPNADFR